MRNAEVVYQDIVLGLRGASLEVAPGEVVAVLGANGAGKTTLLRTITGLLSVHRGRLTKGSVTLDGDRIDRLDAPAIVRRGIAQVMEGRRVFAALTVDENLRTGAFTRDRAGAAATRDHVFGLFPVLAERRTATAGYLSGGEQQMLAIGRALMAGPRLLLLDEPSLGLAPAIVAQIGAIIGEINRAGTSVLLVEQNARMALSLASRGYVLASGRVVLDGTAERLAADEDVRDSYLGSHTAGTAVGADGRRSLRDVKTYRRRKRWAA